MAVIVSNTNNPIYSVDGVTIAVPAAYQWDLNDISRADAGRTEDGLMHKLRIGTKRKLHLKWNYLTTAEASTILSAFQPEYFSVKYLDLLTGGYVTSTFYCGDKTSPSYNVRLGLWENVSFNIIER